MKRAIEKIITEQCHLSDTCDLLRKKGKKIVLTTGAFDLLHEGQLRYLEEARGFGDVLVVGINNDEFVRNLKGSERPIIKENDRAFMIAGFHCVDYVYIFYDRLEIIELVRPSTFVMFALSHCKPNEGNRPLQQLLVKKYGGRIMIIDEPSERRYSTTSIIKKIRGG